MNSSINVGDAAIEAQGGDDLSTSTQTGDGGDAAIETVAQGGDDLSAAIQSGDESVIHQKRIPLSASTQHFQSYLLKMVGDLEEETDHGCKDFIFL